MRTRIIKSLQLCAFEAGVNFFHFCPNLIASVVVYSRRAAVVIYQSEVHVLTISYARRTMRARRDHANISYSRRASFFFFFGGGGSFNGVVVVYCPDAPKVYVMTVSWVLTNAGRWEVGFRLACSRARGHREKKNNADVYVPAKRSRRNTNPLRTLLLKQSNLWCRSLQVTPQANPIFLCTAWQCSKNHFLYMFRF